MNYHHLYCFYHIAKAGSISRACDVLHVSQPALSSQLKQFEAALKRPLFDRHKKRLHLTEDGRMVLDFAERIFDLGQQLEDTLRDRSPSGRQAIQIGVMNGTPSFFTNALTAHIFKYAPAAHVFIEERPLNALVHRLSDLTLDILLTDAPVADVRGMDCVSTLIGRSPVLFAAAPSVARKYKHGVTGNVPYILPTAPGHVYEQVKDILTEPKLRATVAAEVPDMETAAELAAGGYGVAPLGAYTLARHKTLKKLPHLTTESLHESLYLVSRNRRWPNPLAAHLIATFRI